MAKLNKNSIEQLSLLSRIHCTEEEKEKLWHELEKILAYVEQLQEVNTDNIPPCYHVIDGMSNVMREDGVGPTLDRNQFLANAPAHTGGMIRIPPVLKQP